MAIQNATSKKSVFRPPVVSVLGHVDHGKTTILDFIRKSNLAAREAGGITQQIGASQINVDGQSITFIDTPGHAAFEKMRSRGATVADIALLIVAANDGVKPQTIEAIKHIKNANIPQIVVINKIDLPGADPTKVKKQLIDNEVVVEDLGGNAPVIEISAKTGHNMTELLDMILLLAQMEEIAGDPTDSLDATVIESSLDKSKGPLATVLVKNGSLKVGDEISVEGINCKVRLMMDSSGNKLTIAVPSTAIEILGFESAPPVGGMVIRGKQQKDNLKQAKQVSAHEVLLQREERKQNFKVLIKADTVGSIEAITTNLPKEIIIIYSATGEMNKSDILLAKSSGAGIYSFNIKMPSQIEKLAKSENVIVKNFKVIYELLDNIQENYQKFEQEKIKKLITGVAKIVAEFNINGEKIAGCKVTSGVIVGNKPLRLKRGGQIVGEGKIRSLKHRTSTIDLAKEGMECGISLIPNLDFQIGDSIELLEQKL